MNLRRNLLLSTLAAATLGLTACGGGGSTPPPATISVSLTGQPTALTTGATAQITATVSNNTGVTWTVTCAAQPCGSFNPASTASGAPTTFTAPAPATSATVTATSTSDTTKSASATITVTVPTPPAITVAFSPAAPVSINAGANSPLTAVVTNDSANKGVTWKVTCGSSACGSFNPASTASGTATTYTAPAAIPSPATVTVTATSVTDTTKSATATVTIGAPPPILADGNYVYHFSGWDDSGPSFFAGAFTVKSGAITAGEQDFTDAAMGYTDPLVPSGSGITIAGGNIQIVLATANTHIGVNGIETLRGTVVSPTRVLISEFDTFGSASGSIDLQTSAAAPSGGYAFILSGYDFAPNQVNSITIGGVLNVAGTSLSVSNSVLDFNSGGTVGQGQLFTSGTISAPDSLGRVTFTLVPAAQQSFVLTGYVVSPSQIQFVESQQDALGDDLGGMAFGQGSKTNLFSQASIANTTYVFGASGADTTGIATFAGGLAFNSAGGVSGNLAINDGVLFNGKIPITGATYTVDSTGRVTISNATAGNFTYTFQLYLDGNGNAFELGADANEVTSGPAYLQTTSTADFEGPYALQGQGILNATNLPAWSAVGPVTVASDAFTGFTDYTAQTTTTGATTNANQAVAGTETNSSAQLALTGLDSTALTTSRAYGYLPIDGKRVLAIEIDGAQLGILTLETITH